MQEKLPQTNSLPCWWDEQWWYWSKNVYFIPMAFDRIGINKVSSAQQMSHCNRLFLSLFNNSRRQKDTLSHHQKPASWSEKKVYSGRFPPCDLVLLQ